MLPEIGQTRRLRHADGSTEEIEIVDVIPSRQGPRAWDVKDASGRRWLFAVPEPKR